MCMWLAATLMMLWRSSGPVVLCMQTDGGQCSCDDDARSVRYWPLDVMSRLAGDITLTGPPIHIDPATWVQPVSGGIFLLLSSPSLLHPFFPPATSYFLSPSVLTVSSLLFFLPHPILFLSCIPPLNSLSVLCSAFLSAPLPSIYPQWIKLFIWPKPQPAGKQAVSTEAGAEDQQLQTTLYGAGMKHVSYGWMKMLAPWTLSLYGHDQTWGRQSFCLEARCASLVCCYTTHRDGRCTFCKN